MTGGRGLGEAAGGWGGGEGKVSLALVGNSTGARCQAADSTVEGVRLLGRGLN